ncbi:uncharacterized protein LOC111519191 [Drosophila willistoni]|uniref:uncharacterized protein LOC111519191 n=1 Tax=Drosophila willistoni TaxID=7260 RepID=UPI000C26C5BF|nr:uncharacterized protein LOC111519191 [Drosophila willistoni]
MASSAQVPSLKSMGQPTTTIMPANYLNDKNIALEIETLGHTVSYALYRHRKELSRHKRRPKRLSHTKRALTKALTWQQAQLDRQPWQRLRDTMKRSYKIWSGKLGKGNASTSSHSP